MSISTLGAKSVISRQLGVSVTGAQPRVTATFHPQKGWTKLDNSKSINVFTMLSMKMQGIAYITATADARRGDFSMRDLFA